MVSLNIKLNYSLDKSLNNLKYRANSCHHGRVGVKIWLNNKYVQKAKRVQ